MSPTPQSKSLPWDVVEKAIDKEIKWLKNTILEASHKGESEICRDCIYRRIAVLTLSGKIKVKDIKSKNSLWGEGEKLSDIGKSHGREWHAKMMRLVSGYFQSLDYKIIVEPNLNMGRSDLGVYKENERNLYIEIGTISLPKLLFNLESMEGSDFLLVIDKTHAVEFSILKAGYKSHSI